MLDKKILEFLDCDIYKYSYAKKCFQISNYFKTDLNSLVDEVKKIINVLHENSIKYKILKDNTIKLDL
ncbi:hypothetical protein Arnit_1831 [Arcobacter nitrofigilis DSM 7299]|uniref:Uncharacterized protein n=1 Tax=Arcobacter nitrofigilis (strain ATCC 33309 / DSM 7299 / CCUG 15893 / LMG 7604 / NCTC 12251 / CI) TaxID=572480 RepID=D5V1Q1_ARCNC|nr:hypothetical protein Arnit_1831 [Arcobacter nitrofigilis DSM 7299]